MNAFDLLHGNTASNAFRVDVLEITPQIAASILANKNMNNRRISKTYVDSYAQDILNDRWELTNQGIGFYKDGNLADGQHRLAAVVKANKPINITVTTGMERDAINGVDQHKKKSANDILTMKNIYGEVSRSDVAIMRLITPTKLSISSLESCYLRVFRDLEYVIKIIPKCSEFSAAPLQAALVLALYHKVPREKIEEFCNVLVKGISTKPEHEIIIKLRDLIIRDGAASHRGTPQRKQFMRIAMWTISTFANGEKKKRLVKTDEYIYPLLTIE